MGSKRTENQSVGLFHFSHKYSCFLSGLEIEANGSGERCNKMELAFLKIITVLG